MSASSAMSMPLSNAPDRDWSNLDRTTLTTSDMSVPQGDQDGIANEIKWSEESEILDWDTFFNLSPPDSPVPDQRGPPAAAAAATASDPPSVPFTNASPGISNEQQMDGRLRPEGDDIKGENTWESRFHTDDFGSKYHFRSSAPGFRQTFNSTWMDTDRSGNYDPAEESRQAYAARKGAKLMRESSYKSGNDNDAQLKGWNDDDRDNELKRKCPEPVKLLVRLHFRSEEAQTAFRNLATSLAQQPAVLPPTAPQHEDFTQGYRLRNRRKDWNFTGDAAYLASDPSVDLTGHPAARGCYDCLALDIPCSLLNDEFKWPCEICEEDDDECHLVTEPRVKRACERCRRKRWRCSFSDTSDHRGDCQNCKADGYGCVAGPAKHALNKRIRYEDVLGDTTSFSEALDRDQMPDGAVEAVPKEIHPPVSDTQVEPTCASSTQAAPAAEETRPSMSAAKATIGIGFKDVQSGGKQHSHDAIINAPPKAINSGKARDRPLPTPYTSAIPRQISRKDSHQSQASRVGVTKQITTKFCHPIIFNHQPTPTNNGEAADPCHFCDSPIYAIRGLGAKTVRVIDWSDGQGLQEIRGGHRSDGEQNNRVCTSCTTARLQIAMCKQHNMRRIRGVEDIQLDIKAELRKLTQGKSEHVWCAVCPAPGRYECCAEGVGRMEKGCGLILCDGCHNMLLGHYEGNLQRMLKSMKSEPTARRPRGLRADCELLLEHGLLIRYAMWPGNRG